VLKFSGAGQGAKALVAELVAGQIAWASGLPVPELVFVELDPDFARTEPDPEIQHLIRASSGINLGLDYLPGAITFDPVVETPDRDLASSIVWFDAFVTNVDRTPRNANLLMWHRRLWLIDHGAALYFHHAWSNYLERSQDPFPLIKDHVLLQFAGSLREMDLKMKGLVTPDLVARAVNLIPDAWLAGNSPFEGCGQLRNAYRDYLLSRLKSSHTFVEEAIRARSPYV